MTKLEEHHHDDLLAFLEDFDDVSTAEPSDLFSLFPDPPTVGPEVANLSQNDSSTSTPVVSTANDNDETDVNAPVSSHALRCRLNRKRKKMEIDELRASVVELEDRVRRLTRQEGDRMENGARAINRESISHTQDAMMKNKRLRKALVQYLTAMGRIKHAVDGVANAEVSQGLLEEDVMVKREDHELMCSPSATIQKSERYDDLFRNIHSLYQHRQWEHELGMIKLGQRRVSMEMTTERQSDRADICMQVMEAQLLPCSFTYVSEALWRHLSTPYGESKAGDYDSSSALTAQGNDVFGACGAECNTDMCETDQDTTGRLAIRRYVDEGRVTLIWECDGCFQCDAALKPIGKVLERGLCIIESVQESRTTVLRIQVQYFPMKETKPSKACCPSPNATLSADVALGLYRGTLARTFGAIECDLFKDAKCSAKARVC